MAEEKQAEARLEKANPIQAISFSQLTLLAFTAHWKLKIGNLRMQIGRASGAPANFQSPFSNFQFSNLGGERRIEVGWDEE